jgi:hypothetical protein
MRFVGFPQMSHFSSIVLANFNTPYCVIPRIVLNCSYQLMRKLFLRAQPIGELLLCALPLMIVQDQRKSSGLSKNARSTHLQDQAEEFHMPDRSSSDRG